MGNTRPVRANTADRAANTLMTHRYVGILVCGVSFQGNIHTNPVHPSESYLVSAVFFWIGTKIQKKSKKRNTQIEEKIIIFDDQLLYHLMYLLRSIQKCDCSLLCINAHYLLSHINAKSYIVFVFIHLTEKGTIRLLFKTTTRESDHPLENKVT